jgi:hypothetical protein
VHIKLLVYLYLTHLGRNPEWARSFHLARRNQAIFSSSVDLSRTLAFIWVKDKWFTPPEQVHELKSLRLEVWEASLWLQSAASNVKTPFRKNTLHH